MAPLLHRAGLYTNAQYLELRFSRALRIAAAVLQILYRTVAMALVVYAVAVMFREITGLERWPKVGDRLVIEGELWRVVEVSDRWVCEREPF